MWTEARCAHWQAFVRLVECADRVCEGPRVRMPTLCRASLSDTNQAQAQAATSSPRPTALPRRTALHCSDLC